MKQYLKDLQYVLENGEHKDDRTGTGTTNVFGMQTRYNLQDGFPAVTTKKLAFKAVKSELLWFLEGSDDERRLAEILHGTRSNDKRTVWTDNANAEYWKDYKFPGDLGRIYGVQWREWRTTIIQGILVQGCKSTDQIQNLIDGIKNDPFGRRHILTAWNPGELDEMALPPCHILSQFYVSNDGKLSAQMYQRSADMFLGVPFNIASYSLLIHMIAQVTGLQVGEFIHTIGDAHIYDNHREQVLLQLTRQPGALPEIRLNPEIQNINDFKMEDIKLIGYEHMPSIPAKMAV